MKKEWILNDEQLKRRKNSRLNNAKSNYQLSNVSNTTSSTAKSQISTFSSGSSDSIIDAILNVSNSRSLTTSTNDNNSLFRVNHNIGCIPSTSTSATTLFASSRRSTDLPLISPPSAQSVFF